MEDLESHIPPAVRLRAASLGDDGHRWLAGLPDLVTDLEARWSVRVERSLSGGTAAFVGAARTVDGTPVILKVSVPDPDLGDEIGTLDRARGRGYVRLLAHDTSRRAMLLEALGPALDRVNLLPVRQLEVICRLLATAWMVPPAASGRMAAPRDKAVGLDRLVRRLWDELDEPCSPSVLEQALIFARRRSDAFDPARTVLVHGDAAAAKARPTRAVAPRPTYGAEGSVRSVPHHRSCGFRTSPRRSRAAVDPAHPRLLRLCRVPRLTVGPRSIRRLIPPLLHDAPDFRRLWFGQTISVFGDQITQLGLPLVAVLTLGGGCPARWSARRRGRRPRGDPGRNDRGDRGRAVPYRFTNGHSARAC